jgi:hypothetical protein
MPASENKIACQAGTAFDLVKTTPSTNTLNGKNGPDANSNSCEEKEYSESLSRYRWWLISKMVVRYPKKAKQTPEIHPNTATQSP